MRILVCISLASMALCLALAACNKTGVGGYAGRLLGDWVQLKLPEGCVARQIAADEQGGVSVLCEDGRIFH